MTSRCRCVCSCCIVSRPDRACFVDAVEGVALLRRLCGSTGVMCTWGGRWCDETDSFLLFLQKRREKMMLLLAFALCFATVALSQRCVCRWRSGAPARRLFLLTCCRQLRRRPGPARHLHAAERVPWTLQGRLLSRRRVDSVLHSDRTLPCCQKRRVAVGHRAEGTRATVVVADGEQANPQPGRDSSQRSCVGA